MKSFFWSVIFILSSSHFYSQQNQLTTGSSEIVHSRLLNEDREILIHIPKSNGGKNGTVHYPVMYLLDGESFFNSFTGMMQYLSSIGKIPEMIIVGIKNVDRKRDFTPTHYAYWSDGTKDEQALHNTGGGEKFLSFVQNELIPFIEGKYPTAPYRMFVGHYLGGLAVLNAFVNQPSLFKSHVTIDPTVWWDNRLIMKQAEGALTKDAYADKNLFYASANTMDKKMDTIRVMKDNANANVHVKDNLLFRNILQQDKTSLLKWKWKYYPEDNHASVPFISAYDALRFLFKGYDLEKDMDDPTLTGEYIRLHYQAVSKLLGYKLKPEESFLNTAGYIHLSEKRYKQAYDIFRMNLDNYPQSFNAYDSMGDYYLAVGDSKNAALTLSKALEIQDNPDTLRKLQKLQSKE